MMTVRMDKRNGPLIEVLKRELAREEEKIERAEREIIRIKLDLLELGVELPLHESEPNHISNIRARDFVGKIGSFSQ